MTSENALSLQSSISRRTVFAVTKALGAPRKSLSWILRGHLARDEVFVSQTYWFTGTLPRVSLTAILPRIDEVEVALPRAFDRKRGTSITAEEACHLGAIVGHLKVRTALEIGTYDGNTALVMAANVGGDGVVTTVDLPPEFTATQQHSLAYTDVELNLTPRHELARQYQMHPLAPRIKQVYGDSATLDWGALGGPFDLVFIDGCHSAPYVRSDTYNAMKHLKPAGVIVWHDYGMIPEVSRVVDEFAAETTGVKVYALEGTRLAIGLTG
jgi:predicted O-methyltransferase YrrM